MPIDADTQKALTDLGSSIATLQTKLEELRAGHAPKAEVDEVKKFIAELKTERAKAQEDARKAATGPAPTPSPTASAESSWTDHFDFSKD